MFNILFENFKQIDKIEEAYKLGSCMLFAEIETKNLINKGVEDFVVVEGYIYFYGDIYNTAQHTWIELSDGTKIDKTIDQFEIWNVDREDIEYLQSKRKEYSPQQYLELCQKFPIENLRKK